jgi:hypothetical protein
MKCNARILFPTRGVVPVDGADVAGPSARIGYMLQQDYLFDWRTVIDNVLLGAENQGVDLSRAKLQQWRLRRSLACFVAVPPQELLSSARQLRVTRVKRHPSSGGNGPRPDVDSDSWACRACLCCSVSRPTRECLWRQRAMNTVVVPHLADVIGNTARSPIEVWRRSASEERRAEISNIRQPILTRPRWIRRHGSSALSSYEEGQNMIA